LGELSREAREYPAYLLREGGTGLCLFAARFYGVNDAIHMARNNMAVTLVDISDRVWEMAGIYDDCEAYEADAWALAEDFRSRRLMWDAVSCDTFTGDAARRSLDSLDLWCQLARDVVTVTHVDGMDYTVPDGWTDSLFQRNARGGINWLVLTREA
jgi:hypothetical protein